MADASKPRKSSRDVVRRAAKGDVGARLDSWSIDEVERSLEDIQLQGSEVSLLGLLRRPDVNKADVVKETLEYMSDSAEEHAMRMALVWRYAKEHEVWKTCQNPACQTEDAFLDSLDGHQTVRICIQFGTSTDVARRGKINIIRRNWGEDWYQATLTRTLLPQEERGAAGLSKRLLGNIAEMSSVVQLDEALNLWEKVIRERTAVGSRKYVGWKAATTAHLLPCDLETLAQQLAETRDMSGERGGKHAQTSDPSDEILELRSSAGYSSMSPFGARTQTYKSAVSATPRSKGRQAKDSRTREEQAASKQSKMKKAPNLQQNQLRQPQGQDQERFERGGEDSDTEQEEEEEEEEEGERDGDDEGAGNGEKRQRENNERAEGAEAAIPMADTEAQTRKRKSGQAVEQVSETSGNKKARFSNEANMLRESTNELSDPSTGSIATGIRPSIHAIREEASSALRSGVAARSTQHGTVAEHLLQIGIQYEGEAAGKETDMPRSGPLPPEGSHGIGASVARPGAFASPGSTALSTDGFVESVADGSAFRLLEQAKPPTDPELGCSLCGGICSFCEVPILIDEIQRERMYEYAHRAHGLERKAEERTLRKWIRRIRFATPTHVLLQGQGEVCVLSAQSFKSQTKEGCLLEMPVIIKEDFADSDEWTPFRYAELLDSVFADFDVDVRWHQDPEPKSVAVSEMAELCRGQLRSTLSTNPPNILNLSDIAGASTPGFLRMDRFRLLDLIIERCMAKPRERVGKQLEITSFDVASNRSFNLLAWPGAFSGAHVDRDGATWVRNLFGYKLWMFVPENSMTQQDWDQLAKDGDMWNPGDKARAVVLCPGDVFVMRAGLVHAVQTLGDIGPCLMTGGAFWDDRDLLHTLKKQLWIGRNQGATNEPLAYQLAQIVDALQDMIQQRPSKYSASESGDHDLLQTINELRSLGCSCEECDDSECKCCREGRRCTPFCATHAFTNAGLKPCMLEERADNESVPSTGERDEDYVGSEWST